MSTRRSLAKLEWDEVVRRVALLRTKPLAALTPVDLLFLQDVLDLLLPVVTEDEWKFVRR